MLVFSISYKNEGMIGRCGIQVTNKRKIRRYLEQIRSTDDYRGIDKAAKEALVEDRGPKYEGAVIEHAMVNYLKERDEEEDLVCIWENEPETK